MDDRMTRLMRDPQQWKPEKEGDLVAGVVVGMTEREAGYGPFPVFALEADDGTEWEVAGVGAVLRDRLMSLDIHLGDWLGVRFAGVKKSNAGNDYKDFRIVHEPCPRPVNVTHAGDELPEAEMVRDHPAALATAHAKARLLEACQGDKSLARDLWGDRTEVTEPELVKLEEQALGYFTEEQAPNTGSPTSPVITDDPWYAPDEQPF